MFVFKKTNLLSKTRYHFSQLLKDRVSIITGSGSGIGKAIADIFAKQGSKVVIADLNPEKGIETQKYIESQGGTAYFIQTDTSQAKSIANTVEQAYKQFGEINILVNNAASFIFGHIKNKALGEGTDIKISPEKWQQAFDTNILGYVKMIEYCVPYMIKNQLSDSFYNFDHGYGTSSIHGGSRGAIINISSISAFIAQPEFLPYNTTKGAIGQITKCCAMDLSEYKIRVNEICPGSIETLASYQHMDSLKLSKEDGKKAFGNQSLLKRQGSPLEIANVALFLASDQSSFITGQRIVVDGGLTID